MLPLEFAVSNRRSKLGVEICKFVKMLMIILWTRSVCFLLAERPNLKHLLADRRKKES